MKSKTESGQHKERFSHEFVIVFIFGFNHYYFYFPRRKFCVGDKCCECAYREKQLQNSFISQREPFVMFL